MHVLKNKTNNFAICLAETEHTAVMLHFTEGPFKIETTAATREFHKWWQPYDITPQKLAEKWLRHPYGIALSGSDEALEAIISISRDAPVGSNKVVKAEKAVARSGQPSSVAREIMRDFNIADKKISTAFYDACEAAGIDRKLAASVLCIERKKLTAPPKQMKLKPTKRKKR